MEIGNSKYNFLVASDIERDGIGVECYEVIGGEESLIAEIFYWDSGDHMTVSTFVENIPLAVLEALIDMANTRLPKVNS